jgi:hypothetical protein
MPECKIKIGKVVISFEPKSLPAYKAIRIIKAINKAYENCLAISCIPYRPTNEYPPLYNELYVSACQLVHDNLYDITEGQRIRNECMFTLNP